MEASWHLNFNQFEETFKIFMNLPGEENLLGFSKWTLQHEEILSKKRAAMREIFEKESSLKREGENLKNDFNTIERKRNGILQILDQLHNEQQEATKNLAALTKSIDDILSREKDRELKSSQKYTEKIREIDVQADKIRTVWYQDDEKTQKRFVERTNELNQILENGVWETTTERYFFDLFEKQITRRVYYTDRTERQLREAESSLRSSQDI